MSESRAPVSLEEDISVHIFSASAAMVGVCLTVINLFRLTNRLRNIGSMGEELLALDAGAFLISCILAYLALRTRAVHRREIIEQVADWVFLSALGLMAIVCGLVAYELI